MRPRPPQGRLPCPPLPERGERACRHFSTLRAYARHRPESTLLYQLIELRAVQTIDFMTAHWAHLPYELLDVCSRRIVNEVPGISRVVYDVSGKPPATIEWE